MASVALTMVYTPLLKPLPVVKNFVVAAVVAAAIAAGGLAAGAGVTATLEPSVLTFFVIGERGDLRLHGGGAGGGGYSLYILHAIRSR